MIVINRVGDKPARELTAEEKVGLHTTCSDDEYFYYCYSADEVPEKFRVSEIVRPNWLTLEQSLRYAHDSALFTKAFTQASDKGFNLFTVTLLNGKRGDSSENALAFAFSMLGVTWTGTEKSQINTILTENHFTIQI